MRGEIDDSCCFLLAAPKHCPASSTKILLGLWVGLFAYWSVKKVAFRHFVQGKRYIAKR